ncbi:hypothetical protein ABE547_09815 [Dorea sp. YH-dor226]|uniref:serine O-acetyltransferase n=1 Tax=Dorea sp. YH-dor226 TaxID=3151119 RepID=UPI003241BA82
MNPNCTSFNEVKQIISEERKMYVNDRYLFMKWSHQKRYLIWKCLSCFRMAQYWKAVIKDSDVGLAKRLYAKLAYRHYFRQRNIYSERSGVEIANHCVLGRRLDIWHGSVVISGSLGDDCVIHGNNVIGNKGNGDDGIPVLGNGVDLGVGAVVIGNIHIADQCIIGANAVVIKDFEEVGSLIVGVPAQMKGK